MMPLNSWEITQNATNYQTAYPRFLADFVRKPTLGKPRIVLYMNLGYPGVPTEKESKMM